jgi:hypothetical protein
MLNRHGICCVGNIDNKKDNNRNIADSTVRPTCGKPWKMLVYIKNKSAIYLHVISVMKCGCVFWEFAKRNLATRKDKIR